MSSEDRTLHRQAALVSGKPAPHIPPRRAPARRIRDDAEALAVARELAAEFRVGAAERDRERRLPVAEIERFSQAGSGRSPCRKSMAARGSRRRHWPR